MSGPPFAWIQLHFGDPDLDRNFAGWSLCKGTSEWDMVHSGPGIYSMEKLNVLATCNRLKQSMGNLCSVSMNIWLNLGTLLGAEVLQWFAYVFLFLKLNLGSLRFKPIHHRAFKTHLLLCWAWIRSPVSLQFHDFVDGSTTDQQIPKLIHDIKHHVLKKM